MSVATDSLVLGHVETADCAECKTMIPRENIMAELLPPPKDGRIVPPVQLFRAWCEHCGVIYECRRQLRGGVWQIAGRVESVINANRRRRFFLDLKLAKLSRRNHGAFDNGKGYDAAALTYVDDPQLEAQITGRD